MYNLKLDKKGFAFSIMIYGLLILFIVIGSIILFSYSNRTEQTSLYSKSMKNKEELKKGVNVSNIFIESAPYTIEYNGTYYIGATDSAGNLVEGLSCKINLLENDIIVAKPDINTNEGLYIYNQNNNKLCSVNFVGKSKVAVYYLVMDESEPVYLPSDDDVDDDVDDESAGGGLIISTPKVETIPVCGSSVSANGASLDAANDIGKNDIKNIKLKWNSSGSNSRYLVNLYVDDILVSTKETDKNEIKYHMPNYVNEIKTSNVKTEVFVKNTDGTVGSCISKIEKNNWEYWVDEYMVNISIDGKTAIKFDMIYGGNTYAVSNGMLFRGGAVKFVIDVYPTVKPKHGINELSITGQSSGKVYCFWSNDLKYNGRTSGSGYCNISNLSENISISLKTTGCVLACNTRDKDNDNYSK